MKLVCLLLVLISNACLYSAQSPQVLTETKNADTEATAVARAKVLLEDERLAAAHTNKRIKGRKMVIGNAMKLEKKKEHGAVGGTSPMISSSNQAAGKHESEEGSKVDSKQRVLSRSSGEIDDHEVHFVPITADYRGAMHHPPKNN